MVPVRLRLVILLLALLVHETRGQTPTTPARALDALLQTYAYQAFGGRSRTGAFYDGAAPTNLTGVRISVVRLRSGSLFRRGVERYKEFVVPVGIVVQPYVTRLALVYHNLGNWSSVYYPLPGFTYLAPVLGLLAYEAADLKGTNLPGLGFVASRLPILVNFTNVGSLPSQTAPKCVWFDVDGLPEFDDPVSGNICKTFRQGHFSIVVNSSVISPSPAPGGAPSPSKRKKNHKSNVWKIVVGGIVGGIVLLVLIAILACCAWWHWRDKKVTKMEQRADLGEALKMARVGNTQAPVATVTRTLPTLESEYVA